MKSVRFKDDEAKALLIAVRLAQGTFTELISMSTTREARAPLMNLVRDLETAAQKLRVVA